MLGSLAEGKTGSRPARGRGCALHARRLPGHGCSRRGPHPQPAGDSRRRATQARAPTGPLDTRQLGHGHAPDGRHGGRGELRAVLIGGDESLSKRPMKRVADPPGDDGRAHRDRRGQATAPAIGAARNCAASIKCPWPAPR